MTQSSLSVSRVIVRSTYEGPSLCRKVYNSLMAVPQSVGVSQAEHASISESITSLLLSFHTVPRKHKMRLFKAVLAAQETVGGCFPALDAALTDLGWEHLHMVARNAGATEALQVDSDVVLTQAWQVITDAVTSLARFQTRCGEKEDSQLQPSASRSKVGHRLVRDLADAYPRGIGASEVFVEKGAVHFILQAYVHAVASMYGMLNASDADRDTGVSFFSMIGAHAVRSIARQNVALELLASTYHGPLLVDEILVCADQGVDVQLLVLRDDLLSSSFRAVMQITDRDWQDCETLDLRFVGEPGYGEGVVREWVGLLCLDVFHKSGYFTPCAADPSVAHPNPFNVADAETDTFMEFAGKVLGISKRLGIPTGVHLSRAAVTMVTMRQLSLTDLRQLDPTLANSCAAIRRMGTTEEVDLGTFVSPDIGCELFPGGRFVSVSAQDRIVFVDLLEECHLRGRDLTCMKGCHWIMRGMMAVMASDFDTDEDVFTQVCSMGADSFNVTFGGEGLAQIVDAEQWRLHTDADGPDGDDTTAMAVACLFASIADMENQQRRTLLRFWTGTPSLPHGGFAALPTRLKLVVSPHAPGERRLPSAHTCVRTLMLPAYTDATDMRYALDACLVSMEFDDST